MKKLAAMMTLFLVACRGEEVPRDYQNMPPAVSHPVDNPNQAPSKRTEIGQPEPSSGAEGTSAPYEPVEQPAAATTPTPVASPAPAATTT